MYMHAKCTNGAVVLWCVWEVCNHGAEDAPAECVYNTGNRDPVCVLYHHDPVCALYYHNPVFMEDKMRTVLLQVICFP